MQVKSLDKVCNMRLQTRRRVRSELTPDSMRAALVTFLPHPCARRYTAIVLLPQAPLLAHVLPNRRNAGIWAAIGVAVVLVGAFAYKRRR